MNPPPIFSGVAWGLDIDDARTWNAQIDRVEILLKLDKRPVADHEVILHGYDAWEAWISPDQYMHSWWSNPGHREVFFQRQPGDQEAALERMLTWLRAQLMGLRDALAPLTPPVKP